MIRVGDYPIDCALEERLRYEAEVTENPVEKGSDFTDHVHRRKPVLEFEGIVSDTPRGRMKIEPTRAALAGEKPSADAFRRFVEVYEAGLPVTVECSYGRFDNMILEDLSPTRDAQSAKAFRFTAVFKQVRIIQNKRVTVLVPQAARKQNLGFQIPRSESDWFGIPSSVPYVVSTPYALKIIQGIKPLLKTTYAERLANASADPAVTKDLYHFRAAETERPDGWVQDGKYFRLRGTGKADFNAAEQAWEKGGKRVTRQPPPVNDADEDDDTWFGVTRGK